MFEIKSFQFDGAGGLELRNKGNGEFITVFPDFGGMVHQIALQKNDQLHQIIDPCADLCELEQNDKARGAQLFPFANRVKDGKYIFAGNLYQMPINWPQENHAIHGFVRDQSLAVTDEICSEAFAELTLTYDFDGQFDGYPFPFRLKIAYRLTADDGVILSTQVKNTGSGPMPCGDGWHCYFQTGSKLNDLEMKLPQAGRIETDERGIPTGIEVPDSDWHSLTKINDTFLDTGFRITEKSEKSTVRLFDREMDFTINIWQDRGMHKFNYLQLYTPPSRKSIAVEPMTSKTDSLNNGEGLVVLQPGEELKARWGVMLT